MLTELIEKHRDSFVGKPTAEKYADFTAELIKGPDFEYGRREMFEVERYLLGNDIDLYHRYRILGCITRRAAMNTLPEDVRQVLDADFSSKDDIPTETIELVGESKAKEYIGIMSEYYDSLVGLLGTLRKKVVKLAKSSPAREFLSQLIENHGSGVAIGRNRVSTWYSNL